MTDKKNPELSDIDWDSALDEWESKTFVPEVAKDKETEKAASLTGQSSKPLYRAPLPAAGAAAPPPLPPASRPRGLVDAPHAPHPQTEIHELPSMSSDDDEESGATVIAAIPRELLRGAGKSEESPKSARGGLGQLFAKSGENPAVRAEDVIDVSVDAPKITSRPPPLGDPTESEEAEPSVITSAKNMPPPWREKPAKKKNDDDSLKRPSQVDPRELVPEGAMFDPFAEPATLVRSSGTPSAEADPFRDGPTKVGPAAGRPPPVPAPRAAPPALPPIPEPPARRQVSEAPEVASFTEDADDAATAALLSELEDLEATVANEGSKPRPAAAPAAPVLSDLQSDDDEDAVGDALGADDASAPGPALLAPDERRYDPNEETFVVPKSKLGALLPRSKAKAESSEIDLIGVGEEDEDTSTRVRSRADSMAGEALATRSWDDEKPATAWLDAATRSGFDARAVWLESEARAAEDKLVCARGLLVVSELRAILGDIERAEELAVEARELAPTVLVAHRQARGLMPVPRDPERVIVALDAEMKHSPAQAARVHAALLAADTQRLSGDDDGASKRYEQAFRIVPSDLRAPITRAARALSKGETASAALRMPDSPELAPIAAALGSLLRLRGVERKDVPAAADAQPNDALRRARAALDKGDAGGAATLVAELRRVVELSRGATWLAAALGAVRPTVRGDAAGWLQSLVEGAAPSSPLGYGGEKDDLARRALAARGLELGDPALVEKALGLDTNGTQSPGSFSPAERATLTALMSLGLDRIPGDLDVLGMNEGLSPLAAALGAISRPSPAADEGAREQHARARAERVAGSDASKGEVKLARLIAAGAPEAQIEAAVASFGDRAPAAARAVALEMAIRAERFADVSDAVKIWSAPAAVPEAERDRYFAAALIAERAGDNARALDSYKGARRVEPTSEAALRALASLDPATDVAAELHVLADELGEGPRGAILRIEAIARADVARAAASSEPDDHAEPVDAAGRTEQLERAHRAAPALPIAAFLAERIARRSGNVEDVLRWVRERRANASDPMEAALDGVREALLIADRDAATASERLEEAHRARPADVALRELYERMAVDRPADGAAWREQRAAAATGEARALLYTEAAYDYERAGDSAAALRAAEAATASGDAFGLARAVRERAELRASQVSRLADELLGAAKATESPDERREAYEHLAVLDAIGRGDTASAILWHRSILEELPRHKPSLRYVEHALVTDGRDEELEPIAAAIAKVLAGTAGGESSAHAELAARLRLRAGDWDGTRELVELAASNAEPSLWSLRMTQAHARARGDDKTFLASTAAIIERATRPQEIAALLVRAGETAARTGDLQGARELLERAATEDPGDVVTWGLLADVRGRANDARGAAEACESLARTSVVPEHQLLAWYDAGRIWLEDVKDEERGIIALEQAGAIDVAFQDIFQRLQQLYTARKSQTELASLLERRIEKVTDPEERITMEIERGQVLLEVGDPEGARAAFEAALAVRPDDPVALGSFADLCAQEKEWDEAEKAWVRLARLLPTPEEQTKVYAKLGDLYSTHAVNLSRAEVALKEVLRRAPDDVATMSRLVDVYRRQNDSARAVELQQELINRAPTHEEKRQRLIELAAIFESTGHDNRKAEQALETARRAFPTDVHVLRALAEFYTRHRQLPAVNILLDRASADARRALAAGRFAPAMFEIMHAVFELRGKKDAAKIASATLAALEGRPADIHGADARAADPRLDDLVAPEILSPSLRALLAQTGDALDAASPLDMRALGATPLGPSGAAIGAAIARTAAAMGIPSVQVYVSAKLGRVCLPVSSSPAAVVVGEALLEGADDDARTFLVMRALKLVHARASSLVRTSPSDLVILVSAWLQVFNPTWTPEGVNAGALADAGRRVQAGMPRNVGGDAGVMAFEVAGAIGPHVAGLGASAIAWANRTALLAVGDPNAALNAIAYAEGAREGAPRDAGERAEWIGRSEEAKDLVAFSVSDAYAELRAKLGLG